MHQADQQRAPAETMLMFVRTLLMGDRFIDVAVDMEVFRTVVMAVLVKMHAVAPQSPKNVGTQADQHHAHRSLERARQLLRNCVTNHDRGTGKDEQGQRVAKSPRQTVLDDITDIGPPGSNARHRRDMIGFERMLHSEQETESKDPEHALSDFV
jgi:hypothetical protein